MPPTSKDTPSSQGKTPPVPEEVLLKISKEIAIKFIEVGRLTPATFDQAFKDIHSTVKESAGRT